MRNQITIHRSKKIVDYDFAPAGSICEIITADNHDLIGMLIVKPFCTNQCAIILNMSIASTDYKLGVRSVRPLEEGESFTVIIG